MPWGDGTGPMGFGPMTGRAAGYCAGYPVPGFMNPLGGGFGFGGGFRTWGAPSWGAYRMGYYTGIPAYSTFPYYPTTAKQEIRILKNEAKNLENALKEIQSRIAELTKEETEMKPEQES